MHWVYVLACNDNIIYVGETNSLQRRFKEHASGHGARATHNYAPRRIVALYRVAENAQFYRYREAISEYKDYDPSLLTTAGPNDNLFVENHITERFFYERRFNNNFGSGNEWYRVRGGKYTRQEMDDAMEGYRWASRGNPDEKKFLSRNPIEFKDPDLVQDRPLCYCGIPSEVRILENQSIFFVCPLTNLLELDSDLLFPATNPCDFNVQYTDDGILKGAFAAVEILARNPWLTRIEEQPGPCIFCNKPRYSGIYAAGGKRRLCQECLIHKYDDVRTLMEDNDCKILNLKI